MRIAKQFMYCWVELGEGHTRNECSDEDERHDELFAPLHEVVAVTWDEWDDHQLDGLSFQRLRHYEYDTIKFIIKLREYVTSFEIKQ